MKPRQLHDTLRDSLVDLAWAQWNALGVAGVGTSSDAIVDPEALLVATTSVGRWDPRLFDEVLDWVVVNHSVIDASRLRRLAGSSDSEQRRLVAAIVKVASGEAGRTGLERVEADIVVREDGAEYGTQPVFRSLGAMDWVEASDIFASYGFSRPKPELRGMSSRPDTSYPACLRFKARALVGIGARAEVLTYLWTHEWAHGRLIAERGAYNQSPVAEYLATLSDARLAEKRVEGRRTEYRLMSTLNSVGQPVPEYVAWGAVWPALTRVLGSLDSIALSDGALWSQLAASLENERKGLAGEGFDFHVPDLIGWARKGTNVLEEIVGAINERVRVLCG